MSAARLKEHRDGHVLVGEVHPEFPSEGGLQVTGTPTIDQEQILWKNLAKALNGSENAGAACAGGDGPIGIDAARAYLAMPA